MGQRWPPQVSQGVKPALVRALQRRDRIEPDAAKFTKLLPSRNIMFIGGGQGRSMFQMLLTAWSASVIGLGALLALIISVQKVGRLLHGAWTTTRRGGVLTRAGRRLAPASAELTRTG
jgi:hypothetical protein